MSAKSYYVMLRAFPCRILAVKHCKKYSYSTKTGPIFPIAAEIAPGEKPEPLRNVGEADRFFFAPPPLHKH